MSNDRVSTRDLRKTVSTLKRHKGNKTAAAAELGLARKTFDDRVTIATRSGMVVPEFESRDERTETLRRSILDRYAKAAHKAVRHLTYGEFAKLGVTRDVVRHHFNSMGAMRDAAKAAFPEAFRNIIDDLFTPKRFAELQSSVRMHTRFVVTTAVTGCAVHEGFFLALKRYCEERGAALLVIPATDPASHKGENIDGSLANELIVTDSIQLNRNLFICGIQLQAKQIDPVTGLGRIGQRNGSFVYGSPKQRLRLVPNSNTKLPVALMSTGAVTLPDYTPNAAAHHAYASKRTAFIADHDHVMGAVIVEVENKHRFHFRQVQADASGAFVDLGVMYTPTSTREFLPEAIVLGDWHAGETDPEFRRCMVDAKDSVRAVCRPRTVILHDLFDGKSINHHEAKNLTLRAQLSATNRLSLAAELAIVTADINVMTERFEEVIVVKSNHDEFLERYLADAGHMRDPQNTELGCELHLASIRGHDPLRHAVERGLKHPERVRWLSRDEDYRIAGIECGCHGDKGANGARGSLQAMENAYGHSVSGHAHTPAILRGAWQVGCGCRLKQGYNKGPSSWLLSSALVYPNGARQIVSVIDGAWRLP